MPGLMEPDFARGRARVRLVRSPGFLVLIALWIALLMGLALGGGDPQDPYATWESAE